MSGTLFGEIVNSCDSTTGFSAGSISGDDDFAEGTGALGAKVSNTYTAFYTTSLGATAPYAFSSGGGEDGQHFIMWFSSKSKLNATSGYRLIMGNGTSRGEWDVPPLTSELKRNGAFVTRVIDPTRDFDRIAAGSWTLAGNPAQLSNVTQMGGGLQTTVSIMGSFNNAQIDQLTIGWGIRLSGGTIGTPDSFEVARAADEDGGIWGWSQADVLKGGIYIGPATGTAASVFESISETRKFAASPVAAGFFRIEARGAGTDVTIDGANISAEDSSVARWDYTVGSDTNSWTDENSVYSGIDVMTLESFATPKNIKITDITSIVQNGCVIDGFTISGANTANGVALITSDDPADIQNSDFTFSDGHAIEITTPGTYSFSANAFAGYGGTAGSNLVASSGSLDAAIYNNSGGAVTLDIVDGGASPSVRNGASATTTINASVDVDFEVVDTSDNPIESVRITAYKVDDNAEIINAASNASGIATASYSGTTPASIYYRYRKSSTGATKYKNLSGFATITSTGVAVKRSMTVDTFADPSI